MGKMGISKGSPEDLPQSHSPMTGAEALNFVSWVAHFYDTVETGIGNEGLNTRDELKEVSTWYDSIIHRARVALGKEIDDEPEIEDFMSDEYRNA